MQCLCQVKLTSGGGWKDATLTDEHATCSYGQPVVTILGHALNAGDVETIRVPSSCPLSLFDAAINAGYHVLGVPSAAEGQGND